MIERGDRGRTWLLTGATGGYAPHLTERHGLPHPHWGSRIGLAAAEAPAPPGRGFESPLDGREAGWSRTRRPVPWCGWGSCTGCATRKGVTCPY